MRVALVHDWLTGMRGGENVLEVLCEIFPDADLYTLIHIPGSVSQTIEKRTIHTSFLQSLPMARKRYRSFLPLFPLAIEGFDLAGYDLIVSTSHCVAKGVIPPPGALHISYIFTPMRYVWDQYRMYFGPGRTGWLSSKVIRVAAHYLRMWDVTSSARVDDFVSISSHVANRVEKYYRRSSPVIFPPVDCSRFNISPAADDYYLIVSAFAPYKRLDIAIDAFNRMGNKKLRIIGSGQDESKLKKMSGPCIEFLGWKSNEEIAGYYAGCRALIFPGEEDFGIVPLEAMASGRPVIAYGKGGVLETVVASGAKGKAPTGVFFRDQTPASLEEAVKSFERDIRTFDPVSIRDHALGFDRTVFKERMREYILSRFSEFKSGLKDA